MTSKQKYFIVCSLVASYLGSAGNQTLKFQLLPSPASSLPPFFEFLTKQVNKKKSYYFAFFHLSLLWWQSPVLEARKKIKHYREKCYIPAASFGWFGTHKVSPQHTLQKVALRTRERWMIHMFTYQSTNTGLTN